MTFENFCSFLYAEFLDTIQREIEKEGTKDYLTMKQQTQIGVVFHFTPTSDSVVPEGEKHWRCH
jgi:hypothetical protein